MEDIFLGSVEKEGSFLSLHLGELALPADDESIVDEACKGCHVGGVSLVELDANSLGGPERVGIGHHFLVFTKEGFLSQQVKIFRFGEEVNVFGTCGQSEFTNGKEFGWLEGVDE